LAAKHRIKEAAPIIPWPPFIILGEELNHVLIGEYILKTERTFGFEKSFW
jgi:hypothetical protein